jgi:DNA-binding CsgD family transcriptional regulator
MWAAHVGGDEIAIASMYGRHLRRHGFATPICAYFRRDGRIAMGMTLLRRLDTPLFDARAARLLSEWQPFLQDALTLTGVPLETRSRPSLTKREAAVAALVATGSSNADVASALGMTEGTVKAHLTKVYAKLGVRNRTQLAVTLPRAAVVDEPMRELTPEPTFG